MQTKQSRYVDEKPRIELADLCDLKSQINDQKYDIGSCTTVITCWISNKVKRGPFNAMETIILLRPQ